MHPIISIGNFSLPGYGLMGLLGFFAALLFILLASPHYGCGREDSIYIFAAGGMGCLVGAKILYLVTVLPDLFRDLGLIITDPDLFLQRYISGGMVFYGGFFGALLAAWLTARVFHRSLRHFYPVLVPSVALFAGFGRIGCFLAGCCYGRETDLPIGVVFSSSLVAPNGVRLLPVQLMEAAFDFCLFLLLCYLGGKKKWREKLLPVYLLLYAAWRFCIEFFRGDAERGMYGIFSTSQWISLLVVFAGVLYFFRRKRREEAADAAQQKPY